MAKWDGIEKSAHNSIAFQYFVMLVSFPKSLFLYDRIVQP